MQLKTRNRQDTFSYDGSAMPHSTTLRDVWSRVDQPIAEGQRKTSNAIIFGSSPFGHSVKESIPKSALKTATRNCAEVYDSVTIIIIHFCIRKFRRHEANLRRTMSAMSPTLRLITSSVTTSFHGHGSQ